MSLLKNFMLKSPRSLGYSSALGGFGMTLFDRIRLMYWWSSLLVDSLVIAGLIAVVLSGMDYESTESTPMPPVPSSWTTKFLVVALAATLLLGYHTGWFGALDA